MRTDAVATAGDGTSLRSYLLRVPASSSRPPLAAHASLRPVSARRAQRELREQRARQTRRARQARRLVLLGLLLLPAAPGGAQTARGARETRDNTNLWLTLNGEYEVRPRWFADYELNLRFSGPLEEKMQFIPRLSVRYQPRATVRFNWGYNFALTWPYGDYPAPLRLPEHRMWEQVQFTHQVSRVAMSHRYRLEQRWTGRTALAGDDLEVTDWVRSNRLRYRLQGTLPLPGQAMASRNLYTSASVEAMVQWGANVQGNTFDQHRLIWLVGRRPRGGTRMEAGYMQQVILKADARAVERNHTVMVTVFPSRVVSPSVAR